MSTSEVKLKAIYINETDKSGKTLVDKNGNAYRRIVIESENGHKASMFCGKFGAKDLETVKTWKAGDTVKVNLEKKGEFVNFTIPTKTDELTERVERLEKAVFGDKAQSLTPAIKTPADSPTETIDVDQIPF